VLAQEAHHAVCGAQAEGRAAAEADGVDPLDQLPWSQQVRLARAGRGPADVDAGDRAHLGQEDDGAAGPSLGVGPVPDADAGHVGDGHCLALSEICLPGAARMVAMEMARTVRYYPELAHGRGEIHVVKV
jgi:hypothetical protein